MAGAVLGVDFGTKRVGLAVTDPERTFVFTRETLERTTPEADLDAIAHVVGEDGVGLAVVGLPLNVDGSEGPMAEAARAFGVPVVFVDERYTSLEAEEQLREVHRRDTRKRRRLRDKAAAAIILRTFLDNR